MRSTELGLVALAIFSVYLLGQKLLLAHELPLGRFGAGDSDVAKILRAQRRVEDRLEKLSAQLEHLRDASVVTAAGHRAAAPAAAAAAAALAAVAAAAEVAAACGEGHRPYHTVLTAQSSVYQQWQSRIMYFHWKKQAVAGGACTEMVGFTRLTATPGGKPDELEAEMPSMFTVELGADVLEAHFGFGVLNRPNSVRQLLASAEMRAQLAAPFVLLCETDHVFMRPLPNLATETTPAAWVFGYMHANPSQDPIIRKYWPGGSHKDLDPVGPSPLMIHIDQLERLTPRWMEFSLGLRSTKEAEGVMQGWVQEMWGYTIAAASLGIKHRLVRDLMLEASSLSASVDPDFAQQYYMFHYTYGIEYTLGGKAQGINQIGEWSLDKRHYGGDHPPKNLLPPPAGANAAARWLLAAWNEASAGTLGWPVSKSMGTLGWRRTAPTAAELAGSAAAQKASGTRWSWGGVEGLVFGAGGALTTPWGKGAWGVIQSSGDGVDEDGILRCTGCLFADFANANHNVKFDFSTSPPTFVATRVGDMQRVDGKMSAEGGASDRE